MTGTNETLREVIPGLWVSDIDSAEVVGNDFSLVIDCTGDGPLVGRHVRCLGYAPQGSTNHTWTPAQLSTIASLTTMRLEADGNVLVHCQRGVSRSACAAAAVLLWMGVAKNVDQAISMVEMPGKRINSQTRGSLNRWWEGLNPSATKQMTMF